jgi:hypothetical protein
MDEERARLRIETGWMAYILVLVLHFVYNMPLHYDYTSV